MKLLLTVQTNLFTRDFTTQGTPDMHTRKHLTLTHMLAIALSATAVDVVAQSDGGNRDPVPMSSGTTIKQRLDAKVFYFGEKDQGTFAPRLPCKDWSYQPETHIAKVAKEAFCPAATMVQVRHLWQRSGDKCGYNFFAMACLFQEEAVETTMGIAPRTDNKMDWAPATQ